MFSQESQISTILEIMRHDWQIVSSLSFLRNSAVELRLIFFLRYYRRNGLSINLHRRHLAKVDHVRRSVSRMAQFQRSGSARLLDPIKLGTCN
jgi:hypothetical protein